MAEYVWLAQLMVQYRKCMARSHPSRQLPLRAAAPPIPSTQVPLLRECFGDYSGMCSKCGSQVACEVTTRNGKLVIALKCDCGKHAEMFRTVSERPAPREEQASEMIRTATSRLQQLGLTLAILDCDGERHLGVQGPDRLWRNGTGEILNARRVVLKLTSAAVR